MIKLNNITKKYGKNTFLDDISYQFSDTGLCFIIGKSGEGKSTLLNILGGLEKPSTGTIERKGNISYVFQDSNLLTDFSIEENIRITNVKETEIEQLLHDLDLFDLKGTSVKFLSGGEKQRLAIARSLANHSDILVLDEPTGNLDNENAIKIFEILKKISLKKLVIVVSHNMDFAYTYGDYILQIDKHRLMTIRYCDKVQKQSDEVDHARNKIFSTKYQLLYALKLIGSRKFKFIMIVFLGLLSMTLLFLSLNLVFYNKYDVINNTMVSDTRNQYSIAKEFYNNPTKESKEFKNGEKVVEQLSSLIDFNEFSYYTQIDFPNLNYTKNYKFNLIISNENFQGIKITDFVSKYVFNEVDSQGKQLEFRVNSNTYSAEIKEIIQTNYEKVYESYFISEKYMSERIDDFMFYYGVIYISLDSFKILLQDKILKIAGTNFALNTANLEIYMSDFNSLKFKKNSSLVQNQALVSKTMYDMYFEGETLPKQYEVKNINGSINKNLYINKINFFDLTPNINVIGKCESNDYDVEVSEELFNKLIDAYQYIGFDGICIDDVKSFNKLGENGFYIINEDIKNIYTIDKLLNNTINIPIFIVTLIIIFITILALFSSIVGFIDKKQRELAVLKCLGVSTMGIVKIFVFYSLIIFVLDLILSLILGNLSLWFLNGYLSSNVFNIEFSLFIFQISPYFVMIGVLCFVMLITIINPLITIKKIDQATLVKINN